MQHIGMQGWGGDCDPHPHPMEQKICFFSGIHAKILGKSIQIPQMEVVPIHLWCSPITHILVYYVWCDLGNSHEGLCLEVAEDLQFKLEDGLEVNIDGRMFKCLGRGH